MSNPSLMIPAALDIEITSRKKLISATEKTLKAQSTSTRTAIEMIRASQNANVPLTSDQASTIIDALYSAGGGLQDSINEQKSFLARLIELKSDRRWINATKMFGIFTKS